MINATREAPMIRGMVVSEGVGVSKDIVFPSIHAAERVWWPSMK